MTGMATAMQMRVQLAKLAVRHGVAPEPFAPIALAAPVDYPVIIEGLACTSDIDSDRMKFRTYAFPLLPWSKEFPPLLYKHDPEQVAGEIENLSYDNRGNLRILCARHPRAGKAL